jgi:hypothetical protein
MMPPTVCARPVPMPPGSGRRARRLRGISGCGAILVLLVGCAPGTQPTGPSVPTSRTPGPSAWDRSTSGPLAPGESAPASPGPGSSAHSTTLAPLAFTGRLALAPGPEGLQEIIAVDGRDVSESWPTPGPDIRWLSADAAGLMAATLANGSIEIGEGSTWTPVPTGLSAGGPVADLVTGATWSPDGHLAALLVDATHGTGSLLVIDRVTGAADRHRLDDGVEGSPPAWLGLREVAVPARSAADAPIVAIVDATDGRTIGRIPDVRAIASALAAARVATVQAEGTTVRVWDTDHRPWVPIATLDSPDGMVRAASLALDPDGTRLAVGWIATDGLTAVATVYTSAAGWRPVARIPVATDGRDPPMTWLP